MSGKWDDARIELLRKLWAEGCAAWFIAHELGNGITPQDVYRQVHRNGVPRSGVRWDDARIERLRELWVVHGWTAREIAAEFGDVSRAAVLGKLHRMGLSETMQLTQPPPAPRGS